MKNFWKDGVNVCLVVVIFIGLGMLFYNPVIKPTIDSSKTKVNEFKTELRAEVDGIKKSYRLLQRSV